MESGVQYRSAWRFVLESIEGFLVLPLTILTWPLSRYVLRNWGASRIEQTQTWVGDSLVPSPEKIFTRGLSIGASPDAVWKWMIQFGLGKAGFYSYELLERLAGIPVKNVESIVDEFQHLAQGDEVKLHPDAPGIPVGSIAEHNHICFGNSNDGTNPDLPDPNRSWSMYLVDNKNASSRLILRTRIDKLRHPTLLKKVGLAFETPLDFVMEQKMMRTIKRLAER